MDFGAWGFGGLGFGFGGFGFCGFGVWVLGGFRLLVLGVWVCGLGCDQGQAAQFRVSVHYPGQSIFQSLWQKRVILQNQIETGKTETVQWLQP